MALIISGLPGGRAPLTEKGPERRQTRRLAWPMASLMAEKTRGLALQQRAGRRTVPGGNRFLRKKRPAAAGVAAPQDFHDRAACQHQGQHPNPGEMAKPGARAGLARALDELERAERNYEEPELATKAAASAAAAAVRLMRKRPNDSAAQQAGLEALVLATSVPSRVDAALDAGAAAVVQRAAARFCDNHEVADKCREVSQRLLASSIQLPEEHDEDASTVVTTTSKSRQNEKLREDIRRDSALFQSYAISDENATKLLQMFPPDSNQRSPVGKRREFAASFVRDRSASPERPPSDALFESSRDDADSLSTLKPENSVDSRRTASADSPSVVRRVRHESSTDSPSVVRRRRRRRDDDSRSQKTVDSRRTASAESPQEPSVARRRRRRRARSPHADINKAAVMDIRRETAKLRETSELIMDDETVTLPPTAVEREVDGLTRDMGAPYMDVDAELFLSAHGLPQNTRRKRTVRLLERLFAPPVGTINVEEARFLSALDLGRREREMISAARAEEGDRLRERGVARGWSRALAGVLGDGVGDPILDDANSRLLTRRGPVRPSQANRLRHASSVIKEQEDVAAKARSLLEDAASRKEPPGLMSMGVQQVHGPSDGPQADALKVADPTPLLALLRSLDPRNTGVVARSQFERAIRVAAGNALSEDEVQHLADHYATSVDRLDVGKEPGGFAVQRSSTEKSADPVPEPVVDYELFVSSAKLGAAFGAPRSDMPYKGFYDKQQPKPEHDRYIPGALRCGADGNRGTRIAKERPPTTWDEHVRRVREAKAGAFAYLVRRGFGALRTARAKSASGRWLKLTGERAACVCYFRLLSKAADKHWTKKQKAYQWCKARVGRARRHRENRNDAHRYLMIRARAAREQKTALIQGKAAPAKAWELHFRRKAAFEYLTWRGKKCLSLNADLLAAHTFLSERGENMRATWVVMQIELMRIREVSAQYHAAEKARAITALELRTLAVRVHRQQILRRRDMKILITKAEKGRIANKKRDKMFISLDKLGRGAIEKVFRTENAVDMLNAVGACCLAHCRRQVAAREHLMNRVERLQRARVLMELGHKYLSALGERAIHTSIAQTDAREWLSGEIGNIKRSEVIQKQALARQELSSAVQQARDAWLSRVLKDKYPNELKEFEKAANQRESERMKAAAQLPSREDKLKDVLQCAFSMYDIDNSGEIDRQEFIAMMKNGLLLGVDEPPTRDELRDAFRQVDVDRSGAVSFPEFYAWFNHSRNINSTGVPGLDKIVPVRDRALRDMLAAYRRGELELDADDLKPPKPKGAPRRKKVKDAPVVVQKESLASRLAAKSRTMDTNDSVIKRRLKAKRERDAQAQADLLAKDFRANCAKIFDLIDEDQSGTLSLPEIMLALKGKPDVLRFIKTCRNPVLSEFLVPPRVQTAMKECDTNDDGELDRDEWKALSDRSLEAILERHALARGNDDEFIDEFLDMAVIVYDLIDEDMNGTLAKEELVKACGEDEDVIEFIVKCPLPELQDLLNPELLDKALSEMDTDDDGTISKDEWTEAVGKSLTKLLDERQKDRDADNEFAIDFQTKAREVFEMIDADDSWTLDKEELMAGINQKRVQRFLISCGNEHLQYLCVPARLGPMLWELDTSKDGIISLDEWDSAIAIALDKKLEQRAAARNRDKKVAADQRLAEAFDMNADSLEAVRDRKLAEAEGRIDEDGNIISQEEMDRRAEEAEIARLRAIPRNAWGMPLSNRSSLLCAIM